MVTPSGIFVDNSTAGGLAISKTKGPPIKINAVTHPDHLTLSPMWYKWRLCYVSGEDFKRVFLKRYSTREDDQSFYDRRILSYVPAFAKVGINEIRNSIYQRLCDITRITTSNSYNSAVAGQYGGVDRKGSTMEYFLGTEVLTELLVMGKVGIYVDNSNIQATNYAESSKIRPYMYIYKAEQIRSWTQDDNGKYLTVLLEDVDYNFEKDYQLPISLTKRYRYYWYGDDGFVNCQLYDVDGLEQGPLIHMKVREIPFHVLEISASMMTEVADYQIALLNMASSDVQFARMANVPVYAEKYDPMSDLTIQNKSGTRGNDPNPETDGSAAKSNTSIRPEKVFGVVTGRRFPQHIDFPQWIAPDTQSLKASMEKQEQMKQEIRTLLFLALGNLQTNKQSAESKQQDVSQEENGLSYIGYVLAMAENRICQFWHNYENNTATFSIKYPQTYNIKTLDDRIEEATKLTKLLKLVPSLTYKKEVLKMIAGVLNGRTPTDILQKINQELDALEYIVDPDQLAIDIENRLVSHELASEISGYPDGQTDIADKEAVDHAAAIIKAQTPPELQQPGGPSGLLENPAARGLPELSADPKGDLKRDRNKNQKYVPRGAGKKTPTE